MMPPATAVGWFATGVWSGLAMTLTVQTVTAWFRKRYPPRRVRVRKPQGPAPVTSTSARELMQVRSPTDARTIGRSE